jgi:hypothetical protein
MPAAAKVISGESGLADDRDHGNACLTGGGGNARRCLAMQGLLVERSFAGDDKKSATELVAKADQVEEVGDAGSYGRAEKDHRGKAHAPRRSRTRPVCRIDAQVAAHHVRPAGQGDLEQRDLLACRALLRAVHRRRPVRPQQRVVDVAGDDERDVGQPRVQPAEIDAFQHGQRRPARRQLGAERIEQPGAERLHEPGAAVGARTAAQTEYDRVAAGVEGDADDLPGAVRGGAQRLEPAVRQAAQAGHVGELDHGHPVPLAVRGVDGPTGRAGRTHRHPPETRCDGHLDRAVATVRHRHLTHVEIKSHSPHPRGEVGRHL